MLRIIALCIILISFSTIMTSDYQDRDIPTVYNIYCFPAIDNTPRSVAGFVDHVFVAKVNKLLNTEYDEISMPISVYSINVIENMKGKLPTNKNIKIYMYGGITKNNKQYIDHRGDFSTDEGDYYVFLAVVQEDGSLSLGRGLHSYNLLSVRSMSEISNSKVYKRYFEAVQNAKDYDRPRTEYKDIE